MRCWRTSARSRLPRAFRARAVDRNLVTGRLKTLWNLHRAALPVLREIDIEHPAADIAEKVEMFAHVRAIMHGHAVQIDLPNQTALHQRGQAVIDCGHRNLRHALLGPHKNLLGGRVIALLQQYVIDVLPLRRQAETARRQPFGEPLIKLDVFILHC